MNESSDTRTPEPIWLCDIETKSVRWLWPGWLPIGKLAILEGDPGLGKTLVWNYLVAAFSRQRGLLPDGRRFECGPIASLVVSAEDDYADTVVPRVEAAGADLEWIATMPLRRDDEGNVIPFTIPDDIASLRTDVERTDAELVVIDPVTAFMSETIKTHVDASTRRALQPLADLAAELDVCILVLRHWNKDTSQKAIHRGGGSIAFTAAARSLLQIAPDPEEPTVRVLAQAKVNNARIPQSLAYRIAEDDAGIPVVQWLGVSEWTSDQLAAFDRDARLNAPQRREAAALLRDLLKDGPKTTAFLYAQGLAADVSKKTMSRAAKRIKVHKYAIRNEAGQIIEWRWHLPERECPADCVAHKRRMKTIAT